MFSCSAWAGRAWDRRSLRRPLAGKRGIPNSWSSNSTDPAQIRTIENRIDPARTLFLVSSKSGTTLEPNILKQYFFERAKAAVGAERAGSRFIAVTDPGSTLQHVAERDRFRHIAFGKPSIGGRYSVLSDFGLVPAVLMGLDIERLLRSAELMVRSCGPDVPPAENPGVALGVIMAELAKSGRDKVTLIASPGIADFGAWLEQLLAELTGKLGKGLVPIDAEPLGPPDVYGQDRVFVYMRLTREAQPGQDNGVAALERAGHPIVRIAVADRYHIGQEFFRWEMATAVAGAILGLNPFNQPDVEASKSKTRELTAAYEKSREAASRSAALRRSAVSSVFAPKHECPGVQGRRLHLPDVSRHTSVCCGPVTTVALLAYIERNKLHADALQDIRLMVRDRKAGRDLSGLRAPFPPFDRASLQRRPQHRRVPANHLR